MVPNGILGPIGRADVGGGGLVELVHIWMSHSEFSVLEHKSVLVAFSIGRKRGGPPIQQVRTALEPQRLGVAIIEDDPHFFDITAQRLGRDLELLVAEGLQIAPVGWVVPECGADDGPVTGFGLVGVQQGVSTQSDDRVLSPMPIGGSEVIQRIGLPLTVVSNKFVQVRVVPEFKRQGPLSARALGHLPFVGVPHVEGTGQTHPLSTRISDREADGPPTIIHGRGLKMLWGPLNPVGGDGRNRHIRRPAGVTELDVPVEGADHTGRNQCTGDDVHGCQL